MPYSNQLMTVNHKCIERILGLFSVVSSLGKMQGGRVHLMAPVDKLTKN